MPTDIERAVSRVAFDDHGLVPCVMQDARTGEVLTLAYMNEEALRLTLETGEIHLWSRSRRELWHKGQSSGNVQRLAQLRYDCDADSLLALVDASGPACHTGERSCFYRDLEGSADSRPEAPAAPGEPVPAPFEALAGLERTVQARRVERPAGSYSVELIDDPALLADKVTEEAAEVVKAAASESEARLAEESADLLYHLCVIGLSRDVSLVEAFKVLNARRD